MRLSLRAVLVALALGALVVPAADAKTKRAATPRLKAFSSCTGLIGYARRHAQPPRVLVPPRRPMPEAPALGGGEDGGSGTTPAPVA